MPHRPRAQVLVLILRPPGLPETVEQPTLAFLPALQRDPAGFTAGRPTATSRPASQPGAAPGDQKTTVLGAGTPPKQAEQKKKRGGGGPGLRPSRRRPCVHLGAARPATRRRHREPDHDERARPDRVDAGQTPRMGFTTTRPKARHPDCSPASSPRPNTKTTTRDLASGWVLTKRDGQRRRYRQAFSQGRRHELPEELVMTGVPHDAVAPSEPRRARSGDDAPPMNLIGRN